MMGRVQMTPIVVQLIPFSNGFLARFSANRVWAEIMRTWIDRVAVTTKVTERLKFDIVFFPVW